MSFLLLLYKNLALYIRDCVSLCRSDETLKAAGPFYLVSITPFTLALLIRSETGFAPLRAFTLHQLIRINDLIRIQLNHLLEVVSHRFCLLRVLITSMDATRTRTKAEQIWRNQCQMLHLYLRCRVPGAFPLQKAVLGCQQNTKYCKLPVAILLFMRVMRKPVVIYNIIAM